MHFFNENTRISINISLKFVPKGRINNIPALVPIMVWRRLGDKPSSEPMMVGLLTHICVTRPQSVNTCPTEFNSGNMKLYLHFRSHLNKNIINMQQIPLLYDHKQWIINHISDLIMIEIDWLIEIKYFIDHGWEMDQLITHNPVQVLHTSWWWEQT